MGGLILGDPRRVPPRSVDRSGLGQTSSSQPVGIGEPARLGVIDILITFHLFLTGSAAIFK